MGLCSVFFLSLFLIVSWSANFRISLSRLSVLHFVHWCGVHVRAEWWVDLEEAATVCQPKRFPPRACALNWALRFHCLKFRRQAYPSTAAVPVYEIAAAVALLLAKLQDEDGWNLDSEFFQPACLSFIEESRDLKPRIVSLPVLAGSFSYGAWCLSHGVSIFDVDTLHSVVRMAELPPPP